MRKYGWVIVLAVGLSWFGVPACWVRGDGQQPAEDMWEGKDPRAEALEIEVLSTKTNEGVRIMTIYFTSHKIDSEPVRIYGIYACPDPCRRPVPGLLFMHGGGQPANEATVVAMAQEGYAALSIDWKVPPSLDKKGYLSRWPFDAEGRRKRSSPYDAASWLGRRGLTYLEQQPEVDGSRLGVYGFSWGAFHTWLINGLDRRVKAAAPSCGADAMKAQTAAWNHPTTYVKTQSGPVLFLDAGNDFFGTLDKAQALLSGVEVDNRRVIAHNENHGLTGTSANGTRLRWFDHYLRGGPPLPPEPTLSAVGQGDQVTVTALAPQASSCRLLFSRGTNKVVERCWFGRTMSAKRTGVFEATIPSEPSLDLWTYVTADYDDDVTLSSPYEVRPADPGAAASSQVRTDVLYDPATDGVFPWYRSWRGRPSGAELGVSTFDSVAALHAVDPASGAPHAAGSFAAFLRTPASPLRCSRGATALRLQVDAARPATVKVLAYEAGTFFPKPFETSLPLAGKKGWGTVDLPASAFVLQDAGTNAPQALASFDTVLQFYVNIDSAAGPAHGPRIGRIEWVAPVTSTVDVSRIAGAQVPEERATALLHVNARHEAAADENPGTEAKPLRTLARATALASANNFKNIGTRIRVHPGMYRESISLPFLGQKTTDAPLVIEATVKGEVTVSGSDVWDGWVRHEDTGIYTKPWPHKWGLAPYPHIWEQFVVLTPITRRREMVFVDGTNLNQVLSPVDLAPGTFFVSEEKETIYLYAPDGVDIDKAVVEVAIRPSVLGANGRKNVAVRGIVFQHGNQWVQGGSAGFGNCSHVLVEDCEFVWNNWGGFGFGGTRHVTARRNRVNHNGGPGMTAWKVSDMVWEDNETSWNNWRGIKGNFTGWAQGGVKILHMHDAIIRRHRSVGNETRGFWFDSDCANILVEEAYWVDNLTDGIFFEAVQGLIVVRNSVIAFNRRGPGVICTNSGRIELRNNILYGNGGAQIRITGSAEREVGNHVTGEKFMQRTERWTLIDNVVAVSGASQLLLVSPGWDHFLNTLRSDRNLWYQPGMATPFHLAGMKLDFDGWQNATAQDLSSFFGEPGLVDPDRRDFTLRADSPIRRRDQWPVRTLAGNASPGLKALKLREVELNRKTPYPRLTAIDGARWHSIDFSAVANRPLGGDGVPIPNLPHLAPGAHDIHGVRFMVADPATNENHAALGFHSWRAPTWEEKPLPTEAVIPMGVAAEAVYLLQGCAWAPEHRTVALAQFVYEDGTRSDLEIVSYGLASEHLDVMEERRLKSNLADWWHDFPQFEGPRGKKVIVSDANDPLNDIRYIYTAEWINPHPEKTIRELVIRLSDPKHETGLTLFAISVLEGK